MADSTLDMKSLAIGQGRFDDASFSGTEIQHVGKALLYICILGAIVTLGIASKNLLLVSLMLAFYVGMAIAVRNPLWSRTPWTFPQPIMMLTLWWLFAFGIASLPKFLGTTPIHWDLIGHESYLYWALFNVMVANAVVIAGYFAVWPGIIPQEERRGEHSLLEGSLSLVFVVFFWALSLFARGYLFGIGRFGYISDFSRPESGFRQTFTYMYEFSWVAIAALVVELMTTKDSSKKTRVVILLSVISLVELLSVVVMGFKGFAILTYAPAIAAAWGLKRRLPYKALIAGALAVIIITPGNFLYRQDINAGLIARDDFFTAAETSVGYTFKGIASDPIETVVYVWESVTAEFADFLENTALILYKTPSLVPHRGADWYFTALPRALFPRFVWKDKPADDMAAYMTVVYRGFKATTGSPPGYVGELYMRAGEGGVFLGSFVTGALLGVFTRLFGKARKKKFALVAVASVMAASISNTHLDSLIVYLVHRSIIYTAVAWLMFFEVRQPLADSTTD